MMMMKHTCCCFGAMVILGVDILRFLDDERHRLVIVVVILVVGQRRSLAVLAFLRLQKPSLLLLQAVSQNKDLGHLVVLFFSSSLFTSDALYSIARSNHSHLIEGGNKTRKKKEFSLFTCL